jgi:hypothetical protein
MDSGSLLDNVVARLHECRGRWAYVADKTKVPYHTIQKIAQRTTKNPGVLTVLRLNDYLGSRDFRVDFPLSKKKPVTS